MFYCFLMSTLTMNVYLRLRGCLMEVQMNNTIKIQWSFMECLSLRVLALNHRCDIIWCKQNIVRLPQNIWQTNFPKRFASFAHQGSACVTSEERVLVLTILPRVVEIMNYPRIFLP